MPILFFDGVCNLCNGFVDFLIRRGASISYAPLQGSTAAKLLPADKLRLETVVLWENGKVSDKSDAAIRVISALPGFWKIFVLARIFPRFIRDGVYDLVASNRYSLFGKRESCRLPTPEERKLFLD